jgi:hypothetical protein
MYDEEGYDPYNAYYTKEVEEAYFAMLDELGKAATPKYTFIAPHGAKYTFIAPHGAMCYQEYLAYCKYQDSLEDQCYDTLPF